MKIKEDRGHLLRWVMVMLFTFYCSLFTSSAQDDKTDMFNPVEHAVVSLTIAPDARAAGEARGGRGSLVVKHGKCGARPLTLFIHILYNTRRWSYQDE